MGGKTVTEAVGNGRDLTVRELWNYLQPDWSIRSIKPPVMADGEERNITEYRCPIPNSDLCVLRKNARTQDIQTHKIAHSEFLQGIFLPTSNGVVKMELLCCLSPV